MDYHSVTQLSLFPHFTFLQLPAAANIVLLFLVVILFIISFLVAGSEVAFFSLNNKDINRLKTRTNPSYRSIVNLLEQPKTLLGSMLITNSIVNIGIIMVLNILINSWVVSLNPNPWVIFLSKSSLLLLSSSCFVKCCLKCGLLTTRSVLQQPLL